MITALMLSKVGSAVSGFKALLGLLGVTLTYPATLHWARDVFGHYAVSFAEYVGPNPYVTGGEAVAAGQVKLGSIEYAHAGWAPKVADGTDAVVFIYNRATGKVQAFWGNAGAASALPEVDNGTNLSGYSTRFMFLGRG